MHLVEDSRSLLFPLLLFPLFIIGRLLFPFLLSLPLHLIFTLRLLFS